MTKQIEEYFRAKGREGGKLRWAGASPEERSPNAEKAVEA